MFDYSEVAVEIWHQILLAVIDLPYILDTLVDRDAEYWRNSARYEDPEVYVKSEQQRKTLRLVCHSWRSFVDEYKHRRITYDTGPLSDPAMHREALEAINSATINPAGQGTNVPSKPRRIMFHVASDNDMAQFRTVVDLCASKVTTLFVQSTPEYQDPPFDYLITHSSKLPNLRCLAISPPNGHPMPLLALSMAFPNLYTFTIWGGQPFHPRGGDILILPDLEVLEIDLSGFQAADIKKWNIPGLINVRTPIGKDPIAPEMTLEPIRALGANIIYINIYRMHGPIRLPIEFWTWFPRLVEMLAFFSWAYLDAPAPADHPLKYVVHWPHCDHDFNFNPLVPEASDMTESAVLQTIRYLPPGVQQFVVWHSWSAYLDLLSTQDRYSPFERTNVLTMMAEICAERSINVEDQDGVALDDFLRLEHVASS
jgi:hypothetical protein